MALNPATSYLSRYDDMCDHAAAQVIARYSTSFSLATRFLEPGLKRDIRNLYAMVRIADEIVDGTATEAANEAGTDPAPLLDAYEAQVRSAREVRFHTDPVIHAYAQSARRCDFRDELVEAFFASMRRDLNQTTYTDTEFSDYVYGSAEVIGLLCLSAFLVDHPVTAAEREKLESGARALGSAFQRSTSCATSAKISTRLAAATFRSSRGVCLTTAPCATSSPTSAASSTTPSPRSRSCQARRDRRSPRPRRCFAS